MVGRRWNGSFDNEHLVLTRRRLLPWPKSEATRILLTAILDIRSLSAGDRTKHRAQVTVQNQDARGPVEIYDVQFIAEQWLRTDAGLHDQVAGTAAPPLVGPLRSPQTEASLEPAADAVERPNPHVTPTESLPQVPVERPRATGAFVVAPASKPKGRSTVPEIRADGGKRQIWLWTQRGKIHASLAPTGKATPYWLDPAGIAQLLLADSSKAMPAIRTLTGIDDDKQAVARMRDWLTPNRGAGLSASDLAGKQVPNAAQRPAGKNPDGSVRTVSGGLPTLGKRRK